MKYITVYGEVTPHRVITKEKIYWLSHNSGISGKGFFTLKKENKIKDALTKYKIELGEFPHFNSKVTSEKIDIINSALNVVMEKVADLGKEIIEQLDIPFEDLGTKKDIKSVVTKIISAINTAELNTYLQENDTENSTEDINQQQQNNMQDQHQF